MPFTTSTHRSPYNSPYGGKNYHRGFHYPYRRVVFASSFWPFWGWGFPFVWPIDSIFPDNSDNYDSQQPSNNAAPPPSDNGPPYQQPQFEQEPIYPQQPNTYYRPPYNGGAQSPATTSAPVTLVFKDGRPSEKIYNYVLTSKTLMVFDQPLREISVDQIDVDATAKVNREAGVKFSLPVKTP